MDIIKNNRNEEMINSKQSNAFENKDIFKDKFAAEINNNSEIEINSNIQEQNMNQIFGNKFISILNKKFGLLQKIGEGSTSKVYLSFPLDDNTAYEKQFYSIKILKTENINLELFTSEVALLESIDNENVLHIYEYGKGNLIKSNGKNKEVYYIIMEFMEHGQLLKYITNISTKPGENIGFGEIYGRLILWQLLNGLEAIHNSDGVHRDIKPDNIMIGKDYKVKFVDLGFSTKKSNIFLKQFLGTPSYSAPEVHLRKPYLGEYSDIFSLGITLFVLVTGSLPFRLPTPNDMLYQFFVRNDYIGFWRQRKVRVSVSFMQLFDNLVAFDYTQRPSISEIRKSKWMQETNFSLLPKLNEELKRRENIINQKLNQELIIKCNTKIPYSNLIEIGKIKKDEEIHNCQNYININNNKEIKNVIIQKKEQLMNLSYINITKSIENKINIKESKYEGGICFNIQHSNMNIVLTEICKYLKNKGFSNVIKNSNELNILVKNNNFEIYLYFQQYKKNIIKINYINRKGADKEFEQFKRVMKNIKFK